jgi:hypothetical protein
MPWLINLKKKITENTAETLVVQGISTNSQGIEVVTDFPRKDPGNENNPFKQQETDNNFETQQEVKEKSQTTCNGPECNGDGVKTKISQNQKRVLVAMMLKHLAGCARNTCWNWKLSRSHHRKIPSDSLFLNFQITAIRNK